MAPRHVWLAVLFVLVGTGMLALLDGCGPSPSSEAQEYSAPETEGTAPSTTATADTVYITHTGTKYHRGTCRHLAQSGIPISRSEAVARGYESCKVCKP